MASSADNETAEQLAERVPERESDVLRRALAPLESTLPARWELTRREPADAISSADAELVVRAPDGTEILILVEVKRVLNTRDVPNALWRLARVREASGVASARSLLVARYLAPTTRERIVDEGAGYADATGNLHLALDEPPLFMRDRGADRDPWRGRGRPRQALSGPSAARVVRALVDYAPPMTVPDLAKRAGASTGAAYRVVEYIEQEDLLTRRPRGPIEDVQWRRLVELWSQDYGVLRSNAVLSTLEPRGLPVLLERLRQAPGDFRYALSGSLAAERLAPYAPARNAIIYVDDLEAGAGELGLRPVDSGANVVLIAGRYDVAFDRSVEVDGLRYVAPSQAAVDLLTGPGRNPSEGQVLLDWMERHERDWRR